MIDQLAGSSTAARNHHIIYGDIRRPCMVRESGRTPDEVPFQEQLSLLHATRPDCSSITTYRSLPTVSGIAGAPRQRRPALQATADETSCSVE